MISSLSPLAMLSLACMALAAVILVVFLVARPAVTPSTKVWLLLGFGVFPIVGAAGGNIEGYQTTKTRTFCGSCHVMARHAEDASDPTSHSLAARHGRNNLFGKNNCYTCHETYGMFGTVLTKIGGMRHVWLYYTEYRNVPLDQALKTIHIREPFPNGNCMQCHSTHDELWLKVPDHHATVADTRDGRISCASGGCHGYAHPFDKPPPPPKPDEETPP